MKIHVTEVEITDGDNVMATLNCVDDGCYVVELTKAGKLIDEHQWTTLYHAVHKAMEMMRDSG